MSSTKDKFKNKLAGLKSTRTPGDPAKIDSMQKTDEEKLVLLTNWADETEKLLRGLPNPRLSGEIIQQGTTTAYRKSASVQQLTKKDWNKLIDQELGKNKLEGEPDAKKLMSRLNTLSCIAGLLEKGETYGQKFEKARDSKFLIRLCNNR